MSRTDEMYSDLTGRLREAALLGSCASVLSWDEQTYMPKQGSSHRAEQLGLLAGLAHERSTSPRIGELLSELERDGDLGESDGDRAVNLREARRAYDRQTKLPRRLVEELSRTTTLSQQAWIAAREDSDFAAFLPWLEKMIGLKREEAQAVGYGKGVPYDALLDDYEPGMTAA
jgi:carboxypeptidase Taq